MKKIISALLAFMMLFSLVACNGGSDEQTPGTTEATEPVTTAPETTEPETEEPETSEEPVIDTPKNNIKIADGKEALLYIVMPAQKNLNTVYAKDKLFYFFENTTGAQLKSGTEDVEGEYVLLLGDTGRDESKSLKASLTGDSFGIKLEGKKIIIAATNEAFLYDAIEYLIENYLIYIENDKIEALNAHDGHTYIGEGDTSSLRYLFTQSDELVADYYRSDSWPDEIAKRVEGTNHLQGGCTDGEYIYQGFITKDSASNEVNNVCKIVKIKPDFDPNTDNVVMVSKALDLNHTNDMTYNSRTHEIFVCHNNPYRTKVTVIDPDTLTVKRTFEISQSIYSITYNPERNSFAVGLSGGQNMRLFDGELAKAEAKLIRSTTKTSGMTTQGICSDDTFIYHTLWNSSGSSDGYNKNVITVYDWYGNFVGIIGTKITIESENIIVYDGNLYVNAYSSGGQASYMYKIEPKVK